MKRLKRPRAMRAGRGRCIRSLLTHQRLVHSLTCSLHAHAHPTPTRRVTRNHMLRCSVSNTSTTKHHQLLTNKTKQVQNPSLLTADRGPFTAPPRPSQRGKARRVLTREFSCRKRLSRGMQRGMACSAPSPTSGRFASCSHPGRVAGYTVPGPGPGRCCFAGCFASQIRRVISGCWRQGCCSMRSRNGFAARGDFQGSLRCGRCGQGAWSGRGGAWRIASFFCDMSFVG